MSSAAHAQRAKHMCESAKRTSVHITDTFGGNFTDSSDSIDTQCYESHQFSTGQSIESSMLIEGPFAMSKLGHLHV